MPSGQRASSAHAGAVMRRSRTGSSVTHGKSHLVVDEQCSSLGMSFNAFPPGPVVVKTVLPGCWADEQGMEPGDAVLTVNGQSVRDMERDEFISAMQSRPLKLAVGRVSREGHQTIIDKDIFKEGDDPKTLAKIRTSGWFGGLILTAVILGLSAARITPQFDSTALEKAAATASRVFDDISHLVGTRLKMIK